MDLDALETLIDRDPLAFADAVFTEVEWYKVLNALLPRDGWLDRADRALTAMGVFACDRVLSPKPRCVAEVLLRQLGNAQRESAFDRIVHVLHHHPQPELRIYALHALAGFGTRGRDASAGPPGYEPPETEDSPTVWLLTLTAALSRGDSFETLTAGSPRKRAVLMQVLSRGFTVSDPKTNRRTAEFPFFEQDEPWVTYCVRSLSDRELSSLAQNALSHVPKTRWKPIADRIKRDSAAPSKRSARTRVANHAALDAELKGMRASLESIVATLKQENYRFINPKGALVSPSKSFATKLRALKKLVGPVPIALAHFWGIVGSVDLRGTHPQWPRPGWVDKNEDEPIYFSDPLWIASIDSVLEDARDRAPDADALELGATYAMDLAADATGKANYSGGLLSIKCPSSEVDVPFEGTGMSFMAYLRTSISRNGFPGAT